MFDVAAPRSVPACSRAHDCDPRWALAVAILGSSMAFLDGTVVNVALPVIQREQGASVAQMQWVVESYALLLASLVLVGGALADRYGRRRVFSLGVIVFAVASAACGAAPTTWLLVVARGVQGVGAALLVPGSLALISAAYDQSARGAAIGTWSAASGIMGALGPVAGGWLVSHTSWRWLFLLNIPIAIAVVVLAHRHVLESRDEQAPRQMDWAGSLLVVLGLGALVYGLLSSAGSRGQLSLGMWLVIALGFAILTVFVFVEARRPHAMVPLALFRSRTFSGANLLTLLLYAALGALMFFLPFDLIQVQHYSATAAGAALVPFVLAISFISRWAGGLAARRGARLPLVVGPLMAAVGFGLLALPGVVNNGGASYWTTFFPGLIVLGAGMGVTVAPLTTAVMAAVEPSHAGVASGINNAVARTAGLLAIAALGLLLGARFNAALDGALQPLALGSHVTSLIDAQRERLGAPDLAQLPAALHEVLARSFAEAFVSGFRALMLVCAALAAASAAISFTTIERER